MYIYRHKQKHTYTYMCVYIYMYTYVYVFISLYTKCGSSLFGSGIGHYCLLNDNNDRGSNSSSSSSNSNRNEQLLPLPNYPSKAHDCTGCLFKWPESVSCRVIPICEYTRSWKQSWLPALFDSDAPHIFTQPYKPSNRGLRP